MTDQQDLIKDSKDHGLYIARIEASNFKGLQAFDIEPGQITVLAGPNASGKTSAIESIKAALARGGISDELITHGENVCTLKITMSDGMEVRRRKVRGKSPTVQVKGGDGVTISKAQAILEGLCSSVQFNAVDWLSEGNRTQLLLGALPLGDPTEAIGKAAVDAGIKTDVTVQAAAPPLEKIAAVQASYHGARRDAGVAVRELGSWIVTEREALGEIADPTDAIAENATAQAELVARIEKLEGEDGTEAAQKASDDAEAENAVVAERVKGLESRIKEAKKNLDDMREDIDKADEELVTKGEAVTAAKAALVDAQDDAENTAPLLAEAQEHMAELETAAAQLQTDRGEYAERQRRMGSLDEKTAAHEVLKAEHAALDTFVKALQEMPNEMLSKADMPVDGLTYTDGDLQLNGVDVRELSGMETIRLGAALAAHLAQQQKAQFVLMDGLEALDDEQRQVIMERIAAGPIQWIMTEVGERKTGDEQVIIMGRDVTGRGGVA